MPGSVLSVEDLVMNYNQFLPLTLCLVEERENMSLHPGAQVAHLYSLTQLSDQEIFLGRRCLNSSFKGLVTISQAERGKRTFQREERHGKVRTCGDGDYKWVA